jgi:hypothetical protein
MRRDKSGLTLSELADGGRRRAMPVAAIAVLAVVVALTVSPASAAADTYSGKVTLGSASGPPAANIEVEILGWNGSGNSYDLSQAATQSDGTWSVNANPDPGIGGRPDVWVRFAIGSPDQQYYNGVTTFAAATPIPWVASSFQVHAGINAALVQSGAVSGTAIVAGLKKLISPAGVAAQIGAVLKAGGYAYAFKALTAGTALINWYQVPPGAHVTSAKAKLKPLLVAAGRLSFTAAGMATLEVKLTAAGRKLLKHANHAHLSAKATFTLNGKTTVETIKGFTLRP